MITIPLDSADPYFDLQIDLDGATYTIEFKWNGRAQSWFYGVMTEAGDAYLIAPQRLAVNYPLAPTLADRQPPGLLWAVDTSGSGAECGRFDLGARVQVVYIPAAEL